MSETPTIVAVLGMHRSGTSALAGALAAMGPSAGAAHSLLDADEGNPRGYFERSEVVAVNEALLVERVRAQLGAVLDEDIFESPDTLDGLGWLLGAYLPMEPQEPDATADPRVQACLRAHQEEAGAGLPLLLKDPRLCLELPAWRAAGGRWVVLIPVRHPAAVMQSLVHRDGMLRATARDLWSAYLHAALHHSRDLPRMVVDYDTLLHTPSEVLGDVADLLADNGVPLAADAISQAAATLDRQLRRSAPEQQRDLGDTLGLYHRLREAAPTVADASESPPVLDDEGRHRALRYAVRHRDRARMLQTQDELRQTRDQLHRISVHFDRLLAHPVAGPVIRLLRRVKRDPTFGAR